jgi:hypothetical protein
MQFHRLYLLVFLCLFCPCLVTAQAIVPNEELVDTALAIIPGIVALALQGSEQIVHLQTKTAAASVSVASHMTDDTVAIYFESSINFPGAAETRILRLECVSNHQTARFWSVILVRENNVRSLNEGRIPALYKSMATALERKYPRLQKAQNTIPEARGYTMRIGTTFTQPGKYCIGVEAWYDKTGRRNTARLYVRPLTLQ